jgi:(p)ppGpp synthase/HD superfamily hydrolase
MQALTEIHQLAKALELATIHHHGQVDKSGQPILGHALRVAAKVAHLGPRAMAIALLHDAVEDGELTIDELVQELGYEIAQEVELLTHPPGTTYESYLARIKERGGLALQVKLADNEDNADPRRLLAVKSITERERLAKKYAAARHLLTT